jgi:uncharacterized protein (TIGR02996 family)
MSQNQTLLQAILANPDDDAPRLALAAWLEAQGDCHGAARAEFIRLQVQSARLPEQDARRPALAVRERTLLQAHGDAWLRPLPEWVQPRPGSFWDPDPELRRYPFHRGFVAAVEAVARDFAERAVELWHVEPVTGLHAHFNDPSLIEALAASPHLARLTSLSLAEGCPAGPIGARALAASPFTNRLERLDLCGQGVDDGALQELAASRHLVNLTTLFLDDNKLSAQSVEPLLASPHRTRLTALSLKGNNFGAAGVQALAGLPSLSRLTKLDLRDNHIDDAGAKALAVSPYLRNLTVLDLGQNLIGDEGVRALAASPYLARLRTLDLHENAIGDEGARALAASPYLTNLSVLALWLSLIGDAGALALAASPYLGSLARLVFYPGPALGIYHRITEVGAGALRQRFGRRVTLGLGLPVEVKAQLRLREVDLQLRAKGQWVGKGIDAAGEPVTVSVRRQESDGPWVYEVQDARTKEITRGELVC